MIFASIGTIVIMIAGSFFLSFVLVALILKISRRMAWFDHINERKIHTGDIPRLGGLGLAVSFIVFAFIINFFSGESQFGLRFLPVLLAFILILISGIWDDFTPMAPRYKLLFQILAAFCVLIPGYVFKRIFYLDGIDLLSVSPLRFLRYPLTFLWIVGMTNAMNFIDGVDGLAGGVSLLSALIFGGIFISFGVSGATPLLCACLAAAILGFLVFNAPFPRAKIFMGDGGAYFLGFTLALFPLVETGDEAANLPIPYAAAVLMIPIMDTIAAVWRRVRDGRRIDSPDRSHTHHKLINLGLSVRRLDATLFALQIGIGILVYAAVKTPGYGSLLFLILAYVLGGGFFIAIHFLNRRKNKTLKGKVFPGRQSQEAQSF
jgi:UDP-GlcNAc:undecaprenyl-phosphate GlcNAc-1-phosphate transferase